MPHDRKRLGPSSQRPFPWRCRHCGEERVTLQCVSYDAEIRHDGRQYALQIPNLKVPVCGACGEKVFTEHVDDQVNAALRTNLGLLTPENIRAAITRLGINQKQVSEKTEIAEATLSRWLNGTQIQSKVYDRVLRCFFAHPEDFDDPHGDSMRWLDEGGSGDNPGAAAIQTASQWLGDRRIEFRSTQEIVRSSGTTWGEKCAV